MDNLTSEAEWRYLRCLELKRFIIKEGMGKRMWTKEFIRHLKWFEKCGDHNHILLLLNLK